MKRALPLMAWAILAWGRVEVVYPASGTVFPAEMSAPAFLWRGEAERWEVSVGSWRVEARVERAGVGEVDERAVSATNERPRVAGWMEGAWAWRPGRAEWARMKELTLGREAEMVVRGFAGGREVGRGAVRFTTSRDEVGAAIFYRDVPLMPSRTQQGVIKPLEPDAVRLVEWRVRELAEEKSRVVMRGLPVCANCHSFSRDSRVMGMDVDGPDSDKGTYAVARVGEKMSIGRGDVMTWNSFAGGRTIGFMSQVSPDGAAAVTTVGEEVYTANFTDYRYLQVFYPTRGILAWWSRATGKIAALPGADDARYVHTGAAWTPDGRWIVFSRAEARAAYPAGRAVARRAGDENELPMKYDLYRVPFNGGRGGEAEAVRGASGDGWSHSFARVTPDGKWIVFVKARNGLLMRPDGELWIVPFEGGEARRMRCNTVAMNSWHSFSPNGRWMVFASKARGPYTQMYVTHIDEKGEDSPAVLVENATAANRAVNIPEFVAGRIESIEMPAADFYRAYDRALELGTVEAWRRAVELEPEDARARNNLGVTLMRSGRAGEGLAELRRAVELKGDYADARYNLGGALAAAGRREEAVEELKKAVALAPEMEEARRALSGLMKEMGVR